MTDENLALEERMRPEERRLYERLKQQVGKEFVPGRIHPMFYPIGTEDPVQWSMIKRWAIINEDMNALWFDPEYAARSEWGGVTAPPLYLLALDDPLAVGEDLMPIVFNPDNTLNRKDFPSFRGSMMANSEWEFFEPVRPADRITVKRKCSDIHWRQGTRFRLMFKLGESTYSNQNGQVVAVARGGCVYMFK